MFRGTFIVRVVYTVFNIRLVAKLKCHSGPLIKSGVNSAKRRAGIHYKIPCHSRESGNL